MKTIFENNGGTYTQVGDYLLPKLSLSAEEKDTNIDVWARRHKGYLKRNHKVRYYNLLTSGKLNSYLADIEQQAQQLLHWLKKNLADKENIITGELLYRPDFQESEEGVAFSEVVVKQTADVEEYFKNLIRFEGYKVIPEEYVERDMLMHYDELSIQANKLLFLESRDE